MQRFPDARVAVAFLLLDLAGAARAQGSVTPQPEVTLSRSGLEVRFPPLALARMGCESTRTLPTGEVVRWYQWLVAAQYPDASYPNNHFQAVYVIVELADTPKLTAARLDSALARARITVDEARGDPPVGGTSVRPRRAWIRREGTRLRLRVEDAEAVRAFQRTQADSVQVGWCARGEFQPGAMVPLRRR